MIHNILMKKRTLTILFIFLYVFTIAGFLCFNGYIDINGRVFDIESYNIKNLRETDSKAKDILFEYLNKDVKQYTYTKEDGETGYPELYKDVLWALANDIDNDGVDEIIGSYEIAPYCGTEFCAFFILKKQGDEYINIYEKQQYSGIYRIDIVSDIKKQGHKNINLYFWHRYSQKEYVQILEF